MGKSSRFKKKKKTKPFQRFNFNYPIQIIAHCSSDNLASYDIFTIKTLFKALTSTCPDLKFKKFLFVSKISRSTCSPTKLRYSHMSVIIGVTALRNIFRLCRASWFHWVYCGNHPFLLPIFCLLLLLLRLVGRNMKWFLEWTFSWQAFISKKENDA